MLLAVPHAVEHDEVGPLGDQGCGGCLEVATPSQVFTGKRTPKEGVEVMDVVAIQRGSSDPDRVVVITGHLDSRCSDVMDTHCDAPGANDDASGVSALLEAARVLSKHKFAATIVYSADSGEEQGLYGGKVIAQYAVAGARRGLVVGTDHAAEALMGFFTKFGDGACDLAPLSGLTKGRVRELASHLGAPAELVSKVPTADLETLRPQLPDESAFGVSYAEIDAFLEGRPVSESTVSIIERLYLASRHKRGLPVQPE